MNGVKSRCRYCANCIVSDMAYCEIKDKTMSDASAKRINKCTEFEFNPMDAFGEKDYQEPKMKTKNSIDQIGLDLNG